MGCRNPFRVILRMGPHLVDCCILFAVLPSRERAQGWPAFYTHERGREKVWVCALINADEEE